MTVHAPRIKDMDPNHPKNLKTMEPKREKYDRYKPYPPAEGNFPSQNILMRSAGSSPERRGKGSSSEV